jgi:hypothetical protein
MSKIRPPLSGSLLVEEKGYGVVGGSGASVSDPVQLEISKKANDFDKIKPN